MAFLVKNVKCIIASLFVVLIILYLLFGFAAFVNYIGLIIVAFSSIGFFVNLNQRDIIPLLASYTIVLPLASVCISAIFFDWGYDFNITYLIYCVSAIFISLIPSFLIYKNRNEYKQDEFKMIVDKIKVVTMITIPFFSIFAVLPDIIPMFTNVQLNKYGFARILFPLVFSNSLLRGIVEWQLYKKSYNKA